MYDLALSCLSGLLGLLNCYLYVSLHVGYLHLLFNGCLYYVACMLLTGYQLQWLLNGCLYVACMLLTGYQLQWLPIICCLHVAHWLPTSMVAQWLPICCLHVVYWLPTSMVAYIMLPACCSLVTNFNGCLLCCLHVAYWLPTSMVAQWLPICCLHVAYWLPTSMVAYIMLPACCLLVTNFNGCLYYVACMLLTGYQLQWLPIICCLHVAYWLPTSMVAYNMLPACCLLVTNFNGCL